MKSIMESLDKVSAKKHVVTSVEYDCKSDEKAGEIFDTVQDIVTEHLQEFAKITFDVDSVQKKVKVEVIENR